MNIEKFDEMMQIRNLKDARNLPDINTHAMVDGKWRRISIINYPSEGKRKYYCDGMLEFELLYGCNSWLPYEEMARAVDAFTRDYGHRPSIIILSTAYSVLAMEHCRELSYMGIPIVYSPTKKIVEVR